MTRKCLYCSGLLDPRRVAFRCMNSERECALVDDLALQWFLHEPQPRPRPRVTVHRIGRLRGVVPTSGECANCGKRSIEMVCEHCHNTLPSQYRAADGRSIALVGAKASGKSHFVAVLIHSLQGGLSARFDVPITLQALDDRTMKRYDEEFRKPIFEQRRVLQVTPPIALDPRLRYPLAYQLKIGRNKLKVLNLDFFDTAGEDLDDSDLLHRDAKYVLHSDAVIMLLDPLQLPRVREQLKVELPAQGRNPLDLVTGITNAMRLSRTLPLSPKERIDIPLALAFSKLDAVRPLMDRSSAAFSASGHNGAFDRADADEVSESVRSHVHLWDGGALENFVNANWSTVCWFGLSALGRAPERHELPKGIAPLRVEDPLLWFLSRWKLIRTR